MHFSHTCNRNSNWSYIILLKRTPHDRPWPSGWTPVDPWMDNLNYFSTVLVPTRIKYPDRKCEYHSGQIFSFDLAEIWWLWWTTVRTGFNEFYSIVGDLEKIPRFRRLSKSEISPEKLKSGRPVKLVSGFFTCIVDVWPSVLPRAKFRKKNTIDPSSNVVPCGRRTGRLSHGTCT